MIELNLTSDEIIELNKIVYQNKYLENEKKLIYSSGFGRAKVFQNYFLCLSLCIKNKDIKEDLRIRIGNYLEQFEELFEILNELIEVYEGSNNLGKLKYSGQISSISNENLKDITKFISDIYPFGKRIQEYDPDEHLGLN